MRVEKINEEQRRLVPVKVYNYEGGMSWYCTPDIAGHDINVRGTIEQFAKFLQTVKAMDNSTAPRSKRQTTYYQMADQIRSNTDNVIWIWSNAFLTLPKYIIL